MNSAPSAFKYSENILVKKLQGYFYLMKPRVMILVIFTAFVGMMLAPETISPTNYFFVLLSITLGAGSSAAINMWFDEDIDKDGSNMDFLIKNYNMQSKIDQNSELNKQSSKNVKKRFKPIKHFFIYKTFSVLFDLSELEELHKKISIFSYNKFNLFSFYNKDHGDRNGKNLSDWVKSYLKKYIAALAILP